MHIASACLLCMSLKAVLLSKVVMYRDQSYSRSRSRSRSMSSRSRSRSRSSRSYSRSRSRSRSRRAFALLDCRPSSDGLFQSRMLWA